MISSYIKKIYLASQSLGRRQILEEQGIKVIAEPTNADEHGTWTSPQEMVQDLAKRKMQAFIDSGQYKDKTLCAVASDTVVVFNGEIIGKAKDEKEARIQLSKLSGNTHQVYSSYALIVNGKMFIGYDKADVTFKNIESIIQSYISANEWKGAAGSYRIQGQGAQFVERIDGDKNTVTGLPLKIIESLIAKNL